MGRFFKFVLFAMAGLVLLVVLAIVAAGLFLDPNDFRDDIAASVKETTGRDLRIDGEVGLSLFPWIMLDVGKTELGNAEGFGDEPFASFERANLSVKLMPLLFERSVQIGTAELDALQVNMAVDKSGRSNWQDFIDATAAGSSGADTAAAPVSLDVSSIQVTNAALSYSDAKSGDRYTLSNINMHTGRVAAGEVVPLQGDLQFEVQPAAISGTMQLDTGLSFADGTVAFDDLSFTSLVEGLTSVPTRLQLTAPAIGIDTSKQLVTAGKLDLSLLDIDIEANVEPFSYANSVLPTATLKVDAFSLRTLLQQLDIEAPVTADPNALGKVIIDAKAVVAEKSVSLSDLRLVLDDTNFTGTMRIPRSSKGTYVVQLAGDSIDLNRYMAPATEGESSGDAAGTVELPVELVRPLNANGSLKLKSATLGGILFENVDLGLTSSGGKMRINPIASQLFGGSYQGDVHIDVSGNTPVLSVNERIQGVNLAPLASAMFKKDNVTGTVSGTYKLTGRGADTAALRETLNGSMTFELLDGTFEGTDVWYELRRARALLKQEPAPEPQLPPRTKFSAVTATGKVNNGIFSNNDLFAELPFMQLTGNGTVNIPEGTLNYNMQARVLEKPEFVTAATEEELEEFTEAVIPLKVTGPLASPKIKPDIEEMLKKEVEDKIKDAIFDGLFGGRDKEEAPAETGSDGSTSEDPAVEEEKDVEDEIKDRLRDLIGG